jgi:5-methylcytosine-specific restriction enzyme subunit McrC
MKIPIQNIYYLLSYAWNKLPESRTVEVSPSDYESLEELFAKVLVNGSNHLFKKGLERQYQEKADTIPGIKGKVIFGESLKKNTFRRGMSVCEFDEFSHNFLHNQIIKSTIHRLIRFPSLGKEINKELWAAFWRFENVDVIPLTINHFKQVRIHRNNQFYSFLISICRLIFENTVINEETGTYFFKDFTRDEKKMAFLFESFVRNFYKSELSNFSVGSENISWEAKPIGNSDSSFLPLMRTDISLESSNRKIIIDTKFYSQTLDKRFDTEKIKSANLYQLYAYLRNIEYKEKSRLNEVADGILLYPTIQKEYDQTYQMGSHRVKIVTVNLDQEWRKIHERLIDILKITSDSLA